MVRPYNANIQLSYLDSPGLELRCISQENNGRVWYICITMQFWTIYSCNQNLQWQLLLNFVGQTSTLLKSELQIDRACRAHQFFDDHDAGDASTS